MAETQDGGFQVYRDQYVQIAEEFEDFMAQNPEAGEVLYFVNAETKPSSSFVGAKRVPPYGFYGREDTESYELRQGNVWVRGSNDMKIPLDK